MKSAAHQYEDKLLEFAYGELPQHEADAVDAHVRGCTRCSQSLTEIRSVRTTMAKLPMESAPDAGLESLLAYAEQAAKRSAKPTPSIWKRFLMPLASVMALAVVGVVGFRANQEFDTSPAAAAADSKLEDVTRAKEKAAEEKQQAQQAVAKTEGEAVPPTVAAVAPVPADAPKAEPEEDGVQKNLKQDAKKLAALDDLKEAGGKRGDVWTPEPEPKRAVPQSVTRRDAPAKSEPKGNAEEYRAQNFSDVGVRGAKLSKDSAPPPPPPPAQPVEQKVNYGLGSPGTGVASNEPAAQGGSSMGPSVVAKPAPTKAPSPERQPEEAKKEEKAKARAEQEQPAQAPVTAAPAPSTPSSYDPGYNSAPSTKKAKSSLSLGSSSSGDLDESAAMDKSDILGVNNDAKFAQRKAAEQRTQSLESARVASNRGDRVSEIRLAAQVLEAGATGYERVEALKRICDAYEALGEPDRADPFCDQLLQEFPNTVAAKAVSDRRKQVQRAPAPKPSSPMKNDRERKAMDEAKPAEAAPASSY